MLQELTANTKALLYNPYQAAQHKHIFFVSTKYFT